MKRKLSERDPSSASHTQTPVQVKQEEQGADYSQDVKKKLNTASRTGTACDRCRIRKMRCDDQPDGCASCRQAQTECKTTDRITGKAAVRGYVESLESRLADLESHNRQLQAQVLSLGGKVKPNHASHSHAPDQQSRSSREETSQGQHLGLSNGTTTGLGYEGLDGSQDDSMRDHETGRVRLPKFRSGLSGNNYLGISSGNSLVNSVRGTSMNVLGMEIDLVDYLSPDLDEPDPSRGGHPVYNKSYRAFVQTAFGISPKLRKVELPPRSEGLKHAEVYFRITNPFVPTVHKPTFIHLLTRIYDDPEFKPSVAETVLVHAMFAAVHCQLASRTARDSEHRHELDQASNFHYHYALGFFPQLMASHTLADVQALALLCIHVRNCPKPGASWMLTSVTLNLAIELGLHRSAKNWAPTVKKNVLEIETRKRVFWSINWIHVLVGGSLGRPMVLKSGDWDVEMPEMIDDDLLSESGIDTSRPGKCQFMVGIQNFKIIPIYIDLYNDIYAVKRSPHDYEDTVRTIERRIQDFIQQWPQELTDESAPEKEFGMQVQYLNLWQLHIRLLLRHPSLSLTSSPRFNAENLTTCLEVSNKILHHVKIIQKYQCLDATWQTGALFVLAIATTLYGHWERRAQISLDDLKTLKQVMGEWLSIMADMDRLLGSDRRLVNRVQMTIDHSIKMLQEHLIHRAAPTQSNNYPPPSLPTLRPISENTPQVDSDLSLFNLYNTASETQNSNAASSKPYLPPDGEIRPAHLSTYANPQQYAFTTSYTGTRQDYTGPLQQTDQLPAAVAPPHPYMTSYPQSSYQDNYTVPSNDMYQAPGSPTSWRHFTGSMAPTLEPGPTETMSSASALMQLGGALGETSNMGQRQNNGTGEWPMMVFDPNASIG